MFGNHVFSNAKYYAFKRLQHSPSDLSNAGPWDIFLSAFNKTERVQKPFEDVRACVKQWVIHEEYGLAEADFPREAIKLSALFDPPDIKGLVEIWSDRLQNASLCIDSTGFIRPHLLVLLRALKDIGVRKFDVLYSDPVRYIEDENTEFTAGPVVRVDQVPGYQGIHRPSVAADDVLVIGAGYDYKQIVSACEEKRNSKKYILTGLPSLQPHMYQESVLRINRASESIGPLPPQQLLYASANHPFTVAQALHDLMDREDLQNLYLCPIGPKPHVLGFAIYYLRELENMSASIIYPFAESYSPFTSQGHRRTWQYQVEL